MSHEQSITIQDEKTGRWVNLSSVINGKKVSQSQVEDAYYEGRLKPLGDQDFSTVDEAEAAAVSRSHSFDHEDTNMPQGHPEDYAPEELQYGVSEFSRVFGREPATDSEMDLVSRIIAGEDAEQLAADEGDPSDPDSNYAMHRNANIAGDPDIGRADQTYKHRSEQEGPRRGTRAYADGKPKLRITGGEDDLPETDSFDYSGDINAEPRVDERRASMGSPQMLMQEMMGRPQSIVQPGVDLNQMQMPAQGGVQGGGGLPGPMDALVAQMMGTSGAGGNMGGTVTAGPQVSEPQFGPPMPGGPPMGGTPPGQDSGNPIEAIIQMLMQQPGGRR